MFLRVKIFVIFFNGFTNNDLHLAIVNMNFYWLLDFMNFNASRYYYEIGLKILLLKLQDLTISCGLLAYSVLLFVCGTLLQIIAFLVNYVLQKFIFCLLETCTSNCPSCSVTFSQFSLSVIYCVLVALSPCLERNNKKKDNKNTYYHIASI